MRDEPCNDVRPATITDMTTRGWHLCALLFLASCTAAAGVGTWKNFTSMKEVKGVALGGNTYWAATSGGLFRWVEGSDHYAQFTNADGLRSVDLTTVTIDHNGIVWSGTSSGILHAYSPADGTLRIVSDIASFPGQTNKRINALTPAGDTLLISTDFGLSVYRIDRREFGDTFTKFGSIPTNVRLTVTGAVVTGGRIWVAITDGLATHKIAWANLTTPNLLEPQAWTLSTVGSAGTVTRSLAVFSGRVYAGTTSGLFYYDGATWQAVDSLANRSIAALSTSASSMAVATTTNDVWKVDTFNSALIFGGILPASPSSIAMNSTGQPVVGTLTAGLLTFDAGWTSHFPNGPNSSQFTSVTVSPDGTVWGASGEGAGQGFYRLKGNTWKSFTKETTPLPANEVYRVSVDCNGGVWASLYGRGIVEIPAGSDDVQASRVYGTSVGMVGVANDQSFVVTSTVACDAHGNVWTSVVLPANRRVLAVRSSNGVWRTLPLILAGTRVASLMDRPVDRCLAVDAADNLWAIVRDPGLKGVVSLGNNGRIDSVAAVYVTSTNGLPSDDVKTIIVDKENDIWIGTDRGIAIILDPISPTRSGGIAAYKPLSGVVINSIAVDALNQKWVGTSEGVVLLSPDGTQQLAAFTVENTQGKLIDDDVKSIALDGATGTVYFGTVSGLASLTTAAAAPRAEYDRLLAYPNPFRVPNAIPVTIDGLTANSSVKILTVNGTLVREIKTPGGRVGFWDGKDEKGNVVASGVYIVLGFSEDGSQTGTGKLAVIRQ